MCMVGLRSTSTCPGRHRYIRPSESWAERPGRRRMSYTNSNTSATKCVSSPPPPRTQMATCRACSRRDSTQARTIIDLVRAATQLPWPQCGLYVLLPNLYAQKEHTFSTPYQISSAAIGSRSTVVGLLLSFVTITIASTLSDFRPCSGMFAGKARFVHTLFAYIPDLVIIV